MYFCPLKNSLTVISLVYNWAENTIVSKVQAGTCMGGGIIRLNESSQTFQHFERFPASQCAYYPLSALNSIGND